MKPINDEKSEVLAELIEAGREAVALLSRIQSEQEGDYISPWPELDRLSLALDDAEAML